ncbi:MAG: hypothetical protein ACRDRR_18710 [Pseudonocardiaceae bacterium]
MQLLAGYADGQAAAAGLEGGPVVLVPRGRVATVGNSVAQLDREHEPELVCGHAEQLAQQRPAPRADAFHAAFPLRHHVGITAVWLWP